MNPRIIDLAILTTVLFSTSLHAQDIDPRTALLRPGATYSASHGGEINGQALADQMRKDQGVRIREVTGNAALLPWRLYKRGNGLVVYWPQNITGLEVWFHIQGRNVRMPITKPLLASIPGEYEFPIIPAKILLVQGNARAELTLDEAMVSDEAPKEQPGIPPNASASKVRK